MLGRRVALKLLRRSYLEPRLSNNARSQLMREAQAMARLSHPNVVSVHDVGTFEDQVFVAMELVDGKTLRQWLRDEPRPWQLVLEVFVEAGRGLAAAHANGVVHRDFKPENVLVGTDRRIRVSDFGVARSMEAEKDNAPALAGDAALEAWSQCDTLTQTGVVKGTLAYMAPEQFQGKAADGRSDQFSFCIALYEALYGYRPFASKTLRALAAEVCEGKVREPDPNSPVPEAVKMALLRGQRADPEERFPSLTHLLDALTQAGSAGNQRLKVVRKGWARRTPWLLGTSLLSLAAIGFSWLGARSQTASSPAIVTPAQVRPMAVTPVAIAPAFAVTPAPILQMTPTPEVLSKPVIFSSAPSRSVARPRPHVLRKVSNRLYDDAPLEPSFAREAGRVRR
jgi:hypothetical protein